MRSVAVIVAFYLTSTLAACAQPGPDGPPPGYGQNGGPPQGYGQPGASPAYGQQGASPAYAQQGWAGGMQSAQAEPQPNAPPPVAQGQPPAEEHGGMAAKFRRANTTGDGRLTQQQAQAGGMGGVVKHFGEIDRDRKGYVTLQDVRAWHQARHAQKIQNQGQGQGQPAGAPGGPYPPPTQSGQQY